MSDHPNTAELTREIELQMEDPDNPGDYLEFKNITKFGRGKRDTREKEITPIGASEVQRGRTVRDRDPFVITFNMDWDDPVHVAFYAAEATGVLLGFRVVYTARGKTVAGTAYVKSLSENDIDSESFDEITAEIRQRPTWDWSPLYA